jgi:D-3-phosphoglycerate dehydrogenase
LKGKSLGIHAYGNVGRLVANIAKGFGMQINAFDPFVPKEKMEAEGVTVYDTAEDLYSNSQYISLHIPANEKTKNSINLELLSKMPTGATLINTARKEVINESDLIKVLENRSDFKYASDIAPDIAQELREKYPDQCYFTPKKMGAQTAEANINAGIAAINQIISFVKNGDTTFQVNK